MDEQLCILIIDDDTLDRMAVRRALRTAGAASTIFEAESSEMALTLLDRQAFDCILLDYQLPPTDGLTVLRDLRQRGISIPIVMLTGRGDQQVAVELMKAGASDYLTKDSLSPDRLAQSLRSAVRVYTAEVRTAQARAESIERLRFLAEASRLLTASLDVPTILSELADLVVPSLASWCAVDLVDSGGVFQRRLEAPQTEDCAAWSREVAGAWAESGHAAATPPSLAIIDAPLIFPPSGPADSITVLRAPIILRERVHGALCLARRGPAYAQADLELAGELAQRVAVALDNARLYQQAKEAVDIRDEFLSIASHELRTPLTSLLGYVQLLDRRLRRSGDASDRDRRAMQVIVEQVLRLNKMISALLDVSRLQSGLFTLQQAPIDLADVIGRVIDEVALTLEGHTIALEGDGRPLLVLADELRIYQVIQNLVQNAVKYSPGGGAITVLASATGEWAQVVIRDQGIGIPPGDMPHLFDRFFRATNAEERSISGIGLGLYVVHEIVTLHGGTIDVNSHLGQGSSFTLRLPLIVEGELVGEAQAEQARPEDAPQRAAGDAQAGRAIPETSFSRGRGAAAGGLTAT